MNQSLKIIFILIVALLLLGCNQTTNPNKEDPTYTKLSTSYDIDQELSNQIKEYLKNEKDLTSVKAVNAENTVIITIEIPHLKRFQLAEIRGQLKKDINKKFEDAKVELSTDQKIVLELDLLEQKIQERSISKKKLTKEVKRIIRLSKEQT